MFALHRLSLVSALALTALALSHPAAAQSQITAVSFDSGSTGAETSASLLSTGAHDEKASYNLGYTFTVSSPIVVTQLGFFADPYYYDPGNPHYNVVDSSSQEYAQSHAVGIYSSDGTLLSSATVAQSDPLTDYFRYANLGSGSGLTLQPGTYTIAGVTGADDPYYEDVQTADGSAYGITTASQISYSGSVSTVGNSLDAKDFQPSPLSNPGLFGPNFRFDAPVSAAPEPSQWGALGFTVLGLGMGLYRARRRRAAVLAD